MIPYYGLVLCMFILYGITRRIRLRDQNKAFVLLAFAATVLLQSVRARTVGSDLQEYLRVYGMLKRVPVGRHITTFEFGFETLLNILAKIGLSEQGVITVLAILCQFPVFWFLSKRAKDPALSVVIYLTFGLFTFSFSGIRQVLAIGIFLLAILRLDDDHPIQFVLMILFAALFHKTVLICLVAWPLSKVHIRTYTARFLMLGVFAAELLFGLPVIRFAVSLFGRYNTIEPTGAYLCFVMYAGIWLVSSIFLPDEAPWNGYVNYMYLAAVIQCLGAYHMSIGRLGYYFAFFETLLLPEAIERATDSVPLKTTLRIGLAAFCLLYFYTNTGWGYLDVSPYLPFWAAAVPA